MRLFFLVFLLLSAQLAAQPTGWTIEAARDLLAAIEGASAHGLEPEDYGRGRLALALASPDPSAALIVAPDSFRRLATDYSEGRLGRTTRAGWRMSGQEMFPARLDALEREALGRAGIPAVLDQLLPPFGQYKALVTVLAATPEADRETRDLLRVNLERWRWMPRQPGEAHILVNVAAQELVHVRPGLAPHRHRVIVGRPRTPTLQFSSTASGVVLNPPWVVPRSIVRESIGPLIRSSPATARARGYSWSGSGSALSVTQAPGPQNALGHVKIEMPNPYSIFLHDTPNRALFNRKDRALSHGCIRTQDVRDLAARMLEGVAGWDRARIDAVIDTRVTTLVPLERPLPVHIGYFTAEADREGRLLRHPDIYGRDAAILAALNGRHTGKPESEVLADAECRQPARS
ncbi:MAG: L,D-transpeptidase family protein [Thermaurantiacus sp.]